MYCNTDAKRFPGFLLTAIEPAEANPEWLCPQKGCCGVLPLSLGEPKYKKITRMLILCPERLNPLHARKIKYAHQQLVRWSNSRVIFPREMRCGECVLWTISIRLQCVSCGVDGLRTQVLLGWKQVMQQQKIGQVRKRNDINVIPVHYGLGFQRSLRDFASYWPLKVGAYRRGPSSTSCCDGHLYFA